MKKFSKNVWNDKYMDFWYYYSSYVWLALVFPVSNQFTLYTLAFCYKNSFIDIFHNLSHDKKLLPGSQRKKGRQRNRSKKLTFLLEILCSRKKLNVNVLKVKAKCQHLPVWCQPHATTDNPMRVSIKLISAETFHKTLRSVIIISLILIMQSGSKNWWFC